MVRLGVASPAVSHRKQLGEAPPPEVLLGIALETMGFTDAQRHTGDSIVIRVVRVLSQRELCFTAAPDASALHMTFVKSADDSQPLSECRAIMGLSRVVQFDRSLHRFLSRSARWEVRRLRDGPRRSAERWPPIR